MKTLRLPLLVGLALAVLVPFATVTGAEAASPKAPTLRPLTQAGRPSADRARSTVSCRTGSRRPRPPDRSSTKLLTTISLFDIGLKANGAVDQAWAGYKTLDERLVDQHHRGRPCGR